MDWELIFDLQFCASASAENWESCIWLIFHFLDLTRIWGYGYHFCIFLCYNCIWAVCIFVLNLPLIIVLLQFLFLCGMDSYKFHQLAKWSRGSYYMDAYFCSPIFPEVVWKNWRGFSCWRYNFSQTSEQLQYLQFRWQQEDCSLDVKLVRRP